MEQAEQPRPKLGDILKPDTSKEQFEQVAGQLVTEEDRKLFGETAQSRVLTGLLYLAPFAPEPATFDKDAYKAVVGFDDEGNPLRDEEITRLLEMSKQTGVLKETPEGRLMVDKQIHPMLEHLLSQYE